MGATNHRVMHRCGDVESPRAFEDRYERVVVVDEVAEDEHVMVPASTDMPICNESEVQIAFFFKK